MSLLTNNRFAFDADTIKKVAPTGSGVYGIFNTHWIYVGETNNIERRLLEHVNESGTCLKRALPTHFTWELSESYARVARQNALILELHPSCNKMLG